MQEKSTLKALFSNSNMTNQELEIVLSGYEKVGFQKGDYILKEGEIASEYYCIEF